MNLNGKADGNVVRGKVSNPDSIHGKSAYEIAVINGFDGTEEEWLDSLREPAEIAAKMCLNELENIDSLLNSYDKRIANVEQGIPALFETDSGAAYVKNVPANALPYAEITKVGGMTHKDGDTLKCAKVTGLESVGANGTLDTFTIPSEAQALEGYGDGINATCYNYIDYDKKQFIKLVGKVDMGTLTWKAEDRPLVIDRRFSANIPGASLKQTMNTNVLCAEYKADRAPVGAGDVDMTVCLYNGAVYILHDGLRIDGEAFRAANAGNMLYYELEIPIVTDISDLISDDNFIKVEGGGTITAVNEYSLAAPSEITYMLREDTV